MKNIIAMILLISSQNVSAFATATEQKTEQKINCQVFRNGTLQSSDILYLNEKASQQFGNLSEYKLKLNSLSAIKYEIEIFDPETPARSYTEGTLKTAEDQLKWTYWSRDILLSITCQFPK